MDSMEFSEAESNAHDLMYVPDPCAVSSEADFLFCLLLVLNINRYVSPLIARYSLLIYYALVSRSNLGGRGCRI